MRAGIQELVGQQCVVNLNLEPRQQPLPGFPAFVVLMDVCESMVKIKSIHKGGRPRWVSLNCIEAIAPMQ